MYFLLYQNCFHAVFINLLFVIKRLGILGESIVFDTTIRLKFFIRFLVTLTAKYQNSAKYNYSNVLVLYAF